jgi:mRNA degradation ribonuclease J1/J2
VGALAPLVVQHRDRRNCELKRHTDVVGIFSAETSMILLVGARLIERPRTALQIARRRGRTFVVTGQNAPVRDAVPA